MTDLRKVAEMALEFVSWFASDDHSIKPKHKASEIAEALRQALAEPVMYIDGKRLAQGMPDWKPGMVFQKPKREWVGLTEEDAIDLLPVGEWEIESTLKFAKSIEAKLKEKNA